MDLKYPVITIGREYCAYGRTIAAALSEELAIPYFDKDFIRETARQSGYSEEAIMEEGEQMDRMSKFINTLINSTTLKSSYDAIFNTEKEVIIQLAKQGPCIIVGRCSDYVLREAGIPAFNIFLFSDLEHKVRRAKELPENKGVGDLWKIVQKKDELRNTYYKHYTGNEMRDYNNYNICLDVGKIGVVKCEEILLSILKND